MAREIFFIPFESFSLLRHLVPHKTRRVFSSTLLGILYLSIAAGCARPRTVEPELAFRQTTVTERTFSDDLHFSGLADAIQSQQRILRTSPDKMMEFGKWKISRREYSEALEKLSTTLQSPSSDDEKLRYIRNNFSFLEWYGGTEWGEILVTGYFEPVIPGSLQRTGHFSQPLYAKPNDLISIDLKQFSSRFKDEGSLKARAEKNVAVPYFTRADIDSKHALDGRNLELCWVHPVDAFFLQIQGSGTIRTPRGEEIHLTYAEKNGHRYEPVGKYLKERLAPVPVTMQRIEEVARKMSPSERADLFEKNPSYVFFKKSKERAITALGIPATPGRTIASDPKYAPRGSLAFVQLITPVNPEPESGKEEAPLRISRFVVNQDTGGAIKGTDHIDLFWGRGDEAKRVAGVLQHKARMLFLIPKQKDS
jgi:membrane-bound lytic murein transglycosylase A